MNDFMLLELIQREVPLDPRPFFVIGQRLGLSEDDVISRIAYLKKSVIREISGIFESSALGYHSALVAFLVDDDRLDEVAQKIASHAGVSHCYARDAKYNLWFTLTLPTAKNIESEIAEFAQLDGVRSHLILPAVRMFKIGVFLPMADSRNENSSKAIYKQHEPVSLSDEDRIAIKALQEDIPLVPRPFDELARQFGISEDMLVGAARRFIALGILRRYSAVLRHTKAGYVANAMVCWRVSSDHIEEAAEMLSRAPQVSHCYERPAFPDWPYSLYTMIHARSQSELSEIIDRLSAQVGISDFTVARTVHEYKKARVKYF